MKRLILVLALVSVGAFAFFDPPGGAFQVNRSNQSGVQTGAGTIAYPHVSVQVGGYVSVTPTVTGLTPGTYTVASGSLPDGLALNSSTGAITGTVTTTALLNNRAPSGGASSNLGRHVVVIDAGDAAGTDAFIGIDVYAVDIPNPQSLAVFSDAYKSGSNFSDAINGSLTWTKAAGTTDATLTDSVSPLGYSHEFDGSTYFTGNDVLSKQTAAHATMALLMRPRVESVSFPIPYVVGATVGSTNHGLWFFHSSFVDTSIGTGSGVTGARVAEYPFRPYLLSGDSGVGNELWVDGREKTIVDTSSFSTNGTAGPYIGTHPVSAGTYLIKSAIAEAAFWPRTMRSDTTLISSIDYCWRRGVSLKDCNGNNAPSGNTVTIDLTEPTYERPVTCTGSYTLTGTATGATSVTWYASPSGDSGACTGTSSWSCAVSVAPDAAGEGVTSVSITAKSATGQAIARQDVGFYVGGARDCFLAQNVDGSGNATLVDNDLISTWVNLIDSSRNVTASTTARPSFQVGVGSGVYVQPLVLFDGNDVTCDDTASDWTWLNNGTDATITIVAQTTSTNPAKISNLFATRNSDTTTVRGMSLRFDDSTANDACTYTIGDGSSTIVSAACSANALVSGKYHEIVAVLDDDAGAGVDATIFGNGSSLVTASRSGSYSTSAPTSALCLGNNASGGSQTLTGPIFAVVDYQSALTLTQRGINTAVTTWALGQSSLPVNP